MDIKGLIGFDRDAQSLPGKLKNMKLRWSQSDIVPSIYTTSSAAQRASIDVYEALSLMNDMVPGKCVFMGITAKGQYVTEYFDGTNTQISCLTVGNTGEIMMLAGEVDDKGSLHEYGTGHKGTLVLLSLMPILLKDNEACNFYHEVAKFITIDPDDQCWDADPNMLIEFGKSLTKLSGNFYYRTRYNDSCVAGINIDLNRIMRIRFSDVAKMSVNQITQGSPKIFPTTQKGQTVNSTTGKDLVGKFSILTHKLTKQEETMVPVMAPWYITPQWVETEAKIVQKSKIFPIPFRSLLLYGVSGTGKTEGAKAIFSALGLPAVSICCNVDMTMFDFLGHLIPNVDKYSKGTSAAQVSKSLDIPTFEDVDNDFEKTYLKLFGEAPDAFATPADCYSKINELMAGSASDGEPDFIYVESEFVKAYRNGWGIEIQEPTIIKRNSVLAGLNKALDNDPAAASITLPTGEIVHRHPDCMVIMTTNQDYDGCYNIQQSVLSRMQNKRKIENPTEDELVERTVSETKFPDKAMLSTMAKIMRQLADYCNTADITDGVCGPRELANWAKRAYIDAMIAEDDENIKKIDKEYVVRAAFPTIIEKVSQVAEDQEQAVIEVIQKHFTEDLVMSARDEYIQGAA